MSHQRPAITGASLCLPSLLLLGGLAACHTESPQATPESVSPATAHETTHQESAHQSGAAQAKSAPQAGSQAQDAAPAQLAAVAADPESAAPVMGDPAPPPVATAASGQSVDQHVANAEALLAQGELDKAQAEADAALALDARNTRAADVRARILSRKSSGAKVVARPDADMKTTPVPRPHVASAQTGMFGPPLVVNGKEVSENEIKRWLIYGPCRAMLELYRMELIIHDELDRRASRMGDAAIEPQVAMRAGKEADAAIEGKTFPTPEDKQKAYDQLLAAARAKARNSPDLLGPWQAAATAERARLEEALQPTEAEFQSEYHRMINEFKANYPVLDVDAEVSRKFRTVDWFKQTLRNSMYFEHVFYPDDPQDWPETTIEAVRADLGEGWIEDAKQSYITRREHADKTGEPLAKEDSMYTNMMDEIVRDALYGTMDFKTSFEGLPDDLVLTADKNGDGKPELVVTTDEVWNKVKDTVSAEEIHDAKQWFVTSMATHDRLQSDGALLGDVDCKKALKEYVKQFENTYITMPILATQTYFFPSVEAYEEYYCMTEGFKKLMEPKLADSPNGDAAQPLRDYLDHANRVLGLGMVDLEAMMIGAFDIPHFRWKDKGWAWAKAKADEVKKQIDANDAAWETQQAEAAKAKAEGREYKPEHPAEEPYHFWTRMMDEHSEFWDPPPPEKGRASQVGMHNRGRLGEKYRNDLQGFLNETPYSHWVTGNSLTDTAFFDVPEGVVKGPFKGPLGYYLLRVNKRKPPTYPLNISEPKKLQLLKDDYLRVAFVDYSKEAVEKASVQGFDKGD
jgi:hypothetical protein